MNEKELQQLIDKSENLRTLIESDECFAMRTLAGTDVEYLQLPQVFVRVTNQTEYKDIQNRFGWYIGTARECLHKLQAISFLAGYELQKLKENPVQPRFKWWSTGALCNESELGTYNWKVNRVSEIQKSIDAFIDGLAKGALTPPTYTAFRQLK